MKNINFQNFDFAYFGFLERIEFTLKRSLFSGEKLRHRILGPVTFTEACKKMEEKDGMHQSLYVEHEGEIKEVSLSLIERNTPAGMVYRMNRLDPQLNEVLEATNEENLNERFALVQSALAFPV
jgi:hypothetical protein